MTDQSKEQSLRDEFKERRWAIITNLLSMDVVAPFYALMGLTHIDPQSLQDVLRAQILDIRRESNTVILVYPHFSAAGIIQSIRLALGPNVSDKLIFWEQHIFEDYPADHSALWEWKGLLRACLSDKLLWQQLGLPNDIGTQMRDVLTHFLDQKDYENIFSQTYTAPLSDWDLHMYAVNLYSDDDEEDIANGPDVWVHPTCRAYQDYQFWAWIAENLDSRSQAELHKNANDIAESNKNIYTSNALVHPSLFNIGL